MQKSMKNFLLFSIFQLFFINYSFSQTIQIPEEGATWVIAQSYWDGWIDSNIIVTDGFYQEQGDTVLSGKIYSKYLSHRYNNFFTRREGNQLFCFLPYYDREYLLFDYDLIVGDQFTLIYHPGFDSINMVLDSVAFSNYLDNTSRKTYYFTDTYNRPMTWVEGFGYTGIGLLPIKGIDSRFYLSCYANASEKVFHSNWFGVGCDSILNENQKELPIIPLQNKYLIYPNPANQYATFHFKENISGTLDLYHSDGRLIFQTLIEEPDNKISILTNQFENGMYYVVFKNDKGIECVEKLIILH